MWLFAISILILSGHAADFNSLKWSEGSHPSLAAPIAGPVADDVKEFTTLNKDDKKHRQKRLVHGQDYLQQSVVPKYLVRIVRKNRGSDTKLTWCTGSIIAPGFVQTAAWCVFDQPDKKWRKSVIPFSELQIIAGEYDMREVDGTEQILEPIQYHIHPRYKYSALRNNLEFDFAIIQLKTNFTYNDRVGQIEIWTDPLPSARTDYDTPYYWFKMSGFGGAETGEASDTNSKWATTEGEQFYPRYQYYAWVGEGDANCLHNFFPNEKVKEFGYYLPDTDRGKVCFFIGLDVDVPYQVGAGDWGAPVTWFNHTEDKEYLMLYAPYEPLIRTGNIVRGEMELRWGARLGFYQDFTDFTLLKPADDYYAELNAITTPQTQSVSLDLTDSFMDDMMEWMPANKEDQFRMINKAKKIKFTSNKRGDMNYHYERYIKEYTFFLSTEQGSFVNVDISYEPDSRIGTNTTIYVRNGTGGGEIIKHLTAGNEDTTLAVHGIGHQMTVEVIVANYEWTIQQLNKTQELEPIVINVTYSSSSEQGSNVGDRCYDGYLECEDKSYCVLPSAVCDMSYDCLDGKDERLWCLGVNCKASEYRCSTGECIPAWKLCDGPCDCTDTNLCEDENATLTCTAAQFDETFPENYMESGSKKVMVHNMNLLILPAVVLFLGWPNY